VDPVTSDPDGCLNLTMEMDLAGVTTQFATNIISMNSTGAAMPA